MPTTHTKLFDLREGDKILIDGLRWDFVAFEKKSAMANRFGDEMWSPPTLFVQRNGWEAWRRFDSDSDTVDLWTTPS